MVFRAHAAVDCAVQSRQWLQHKLITCRTTNQVLDTAKVNTGTTRYDSSIGALNVDIQAFIFCCEIKFVIINMTDRRRPAQLASDAAGRADGEDIIRITTSQILEVFKVKAVNVASVLTCDVPICIGIRTCLLYTSPSPRDQRGSRMPSSA